MLHAVIMAGGTGKRFWPASRAARPKQFLSFHGGLPLLEETFDRVSGLVPPDRILVMTGAAHAALVGDLLPELPRENIVGEPTGRDTAPCIGLAAVILKHRDPDAVLAVMPSDHHIRPGELFRASLASAEGFLKTRRETLVTFGIQPVRPATGYGYIKRGEERHRGEGITFFAADAFHEKPDAATAESYLQDGGYYWNSGVFVWRADTILENIRAHLPDLHRGLGLLADRAGEEDFGRVLEQVYPGLPGISIDHGVMEKAGDRAVAAVKYAWDDVGSWSALERLVAADDEGNRVRGDFVGTGVSNLIVSASGGVVAAAGVSDLVIVHTPDATLVCRRDDPEAVKEIVDRLKEEYR